MCRILGGRQSVIFVSSHSYALVAVTFSTKAEQQPRSRVAALCDEAAQDPMTIGPMPNPHCRKSQRKGRLEDNKRRNENSDAICRLAENSEGVGGECHHQETRATRRWVVVLRRRRKSALTVPFGSDRHEGNVGIQSVGEQIRMPDPVHTMPSRHRRRETPS